VVTGHIQQLRWSSWLHTIVTMTTTLVAYYDFSYHNYHMIVTTTTTLVVEYDFSHHNYHTIVTMTTTLVVEYDLSPQLPYDYNRFFIII
jgi:hypothetical protein